MTALNLRWKDLGRPPVAWALSPLEARREASRTVYVSSWLRLQMKPVSDARIIGDATREDAHHPGMNFAFVSIVDLVPASAKELLFGSYVEYAATISIANHFGMITTF